MSGYQNPQGHAAAPNASLEQAASRVWLNHLLWAIGFYRIADPAAKDTSTLLHVISNLSTGSQDRAVALINSPVMQEWMTSTVSRPLLVNGHMHSSEEEIRQSPLSFFCAKLVDSILPRTSSQPAGDCFVVRWFCGQHTDFRDYGPDLSDFDAHPPGMLSNMLGQLAEQLFRCPLVPQLGYLPKPKEYPPLSTLCSLFTVLVGSLPRGSILYIVVDGISYYEDKSRLAECMEVLSTITEMARGVPGDTDNECLVKLLVTAPLRSHHVEDLFADPETLNLDEYIERNDGYTESMWNMGIGRVISSG